MNGTILCLVIVIAPSLIILVKNATLTLQVILWSTWVDNQGLGVLSREDLNAKGKVGQRVKMGPSQKFLTRVRSGQFFVARVGSAIYGLGLNLENFP